MCFSKFFSKKRLSYNPVFNIVGHGHIKDFKISNLIPGYGKNYFKLTTEGGAYELYIRYMKEKDGYCPTCHEVLTKYYSRFGEVKTRYYLNLEYLLPFIGSVTIDRNNTTDKKVCYIFKFLFHDEEIDIDGYLKVHGETGKRIFEYYNEKFLSNK